MAPIATSESLADLLEMLVNVPSETGHESAIADLVQDRLAAAARGETLRTGNCVLWRSAARDPRGGTPGTARPLIVLAGHLDTVPARNNQRARREGGNLFGVGSTD